ncbi:MAG: hypothetical protein AAFX85_05470 [Pseudomonadota bacterium]
MTPPLLAPADLRWCEESVAPNARRMSLRTQAGREVSTSTYLTLLGYSASFADWYSTKLLESIGSAVFWEHPKITRECLDRPAQWVLIDAPALDGVRADASAFAEHLDAAGPAHVRRFENLGGDAELVVARSPAQDAPFAHLAAFLRYASPDQRRALWAATGQAVMEIVARRPVWLSTSGLGVPWLHIRLDSTPKYYQFAPYVRLPVGPR